MEILLPLILGALVPFKLEDENYLLVAFAGGIVSDLIYGSIIGMTSLYFLFIFLVLAIYSRSARLRIRLKLAFSFLICFIYFYVLRRFFL